jgi:hypothetical protein
VKAFPPIREVHQCFAFPFDHLLPTPYLQAQPIGSLQDLIIVVSHLIVSDEAQVDNYDGDWREVTPSASLTGTQSSKLAGTATV